ncbi:GNAT family N-acetyltransferase [Streptomyces sp. NPDC057486]|uniref:GNAT family N-acetyltransferase n=1 Tax=Streptomyces sp. NPDC057486 TaxID=3346145 RepID=UPI0036BC4833
MLETPRLLLRRWREEDVVPLTAVNADPEVMRWIGDGGVRNEQQNRGGIEAMERDWEAQGFGLFAVHASMRGQSVVGADALVASVWASVKS